MSHPSLILRDVGSSRRGDGVSRARVQLQHRLLVRRTAHTGEAAVLAVEELREDVWSRASHGLVSQAVAAPAPDQEGAVLGGLGTRAGPVLDPRWTHVVGL